MENIFEREEWMLGKDAVKSLIDKQVALFGLGGVGGACFEALVRAGIGTIYVIDGDKFASSNLNRQILSDQSSIGSPKTEVAVKRGLSINPSIEIVPFNEFYRPEHPCIEDFSKFDYVIDCIDDVKAKLDIIAKATEAGAPIISALGCGNKIHPESLHVSDIFKTDTDPLARVIRQKLRKMGIKKLDVVYSNEKRILNDEDSTRIGSISFVPPVAGYLMAGHVIRSLLNIQ